MAVSLCDGNLSGLSVYLSIHLCPSNVYIPGPTGVPAHPGHDGGFGPGENDPDRAAEHQDGTSRADSCGFLPGLSYRERTLPADDPGADGRYSGDGLQENSESLCRGGGELPRSHDPMLLHGSDPEYHFCRQRAFSQQLGDCVSDRLCVAGAVLRDDALARLGGNAGRAGSAQCGSVPLDCPVDCREQNVLLVRAAVSRVYPVSSWLGPFKACKELQV